MVIRKGDELDVRYKGTANIGGVYRQLVTNQGAIFVWESYSVQNGHDYIDYEYHHVIYAYFSYK